MITYADRAFLSVNGNKLADVERASLKQNHNRKASPTMTPNRRNRGIVEGNLEIDISLSLKVQNDLARPKLEKIDYKGNDVQLTYVVGADQFVATGLFLKTNDDSASGVGQEATAGFEFGALDLVDAVGNSVLFDVEL